MKVMFKGKFASVRAADFVLIGHQEIQKLHVNKDSSSLFFYPKFHFGDFRYAWGNPITYWDSGDLSLDRLIDRTWHQFRAGSTISIYFTVGLSIPLEDKTANRCLRLERDYGHGTTVAEANNDLLRLRELFDFFRHKKNAKDCINWALSNISYFGYWHDENNFILSNQSQPVYAWSPRHFSKREAAFISNKLNRKRYCKDMTQYFYYSSDAYQLRHANGTIVHFRHLGYRIALV